MEFRYPAIIQLSEEISNIQFADKLFYVKKENKNLLYGLKVGDNVIPNIQNDRITSFPEDVKINSITSNEDNILMFPTLPDLPIVFKNETQISLLPGKRTTVFGMIPAIIKIYTGNESEEDLMQSVPIKELSQTWFGEMEGGELSVAIKNRIAYSIKEMDKNPFNIICPIKLENRSKSRLDVQKIPVPSAQLAVFQTEKGLMTNLVEIGFDSLDQNSIQVVNIPKSISASNKQIVAAKIKSKANLIQRSFHFFKSNSQQQ